jgi:hypothetical protein
MSPAEPSAYGHLIGEVIRRITGQRPCESFASETAKPRGADFHIGLAPSEFQRVTYLMAPQWPPTDLSQLDPDGSEFEQNGCR